MEDPSLLPENSVLDSSDLSGVLHSLPPDNLIFNSVQDSPVLAGDPAMSPENKKDDDDADCSSAQKSFGQESPHSCSSSSADSFYLVTSDDSEILMSKLISKDVGDKFLMSMNKIFSMQPDDFRMCDFREELVALLDQQVLELTREETVAMGKKEFDNAKLSILQSWSGCVNALSNTIRVFDLAKIGMGALTLEGVRKNNEFEVWKIDMKAKKYQIEKIRKLVIDYLKDGKPKEEVSLFSALIRRMTSRF